MANQDKIWISVAIMATVSLIAGYVYTNMAIDNDPYKDKELLKRGLDLPIIWLYYDNSEVNSRYWADFGSRSSRALNMPFLNLCYDNIVTLNNKEYRVEVIGGLQGIAEKLDGVENMPTKMRNLLSYVGEAERNWIRAAILAKYGGLWLEPSSICLRKFGNLPDKIIFFGTDLDEQFSGPEGTDIPGMRGIWCYKAGHEVFINWAKAAYNRLENQNGGGQIRNDAKWDWIEYASKNQDVIVWSYGEVDRKGASGKRIEIDDLFMTGEIDKMPFAISNKAYYVGIPWYEIKQRSKYGWFLRMSEEQIMENDLIIKYLLMIGSTIKTI
jgi:hypothetical protein